MSFPQSTNYTVVMKAYLSSDHVSPATGKTLSVFISKAGGAFGNPSAGASTATEIANGWYSYALSTTDTGTIGDLIVRLTAAGIDDAERILPIVNANTGGLAALPNVASGSSGAIPTTGTGSNQINVSSGQVLVQTGTGSGQLSVTSGVIDANLKQVLGSAVSLDTNNTLNVSTKYWGGSSTSVGLDALPKVSLWGILGTALTETVTSQIEAGFKKFFDVGVPTSTMNRMTLTDTVTTYSGNTPQTGDAFALIGTAGAGLTNLGDSRIAHLNADVSSRMATYTQPTGFLTATFPSGTIANTTNITAGTVTTATNVTNPVTISTGTGTGQINLNSGNVPIDFTTTLPTSPTANSVGEALFIADILGGRINTAQAGSPTTITMDAGASSDAMAYVGDDIYLYGGTGGGIRGSGQRRTIVSYNTSTKVATVHRAWDTNPDATTRFITLPAAQANLGMIQGVQISTPATAGLLDVNVKNYNNQAALTDANNLPKVDIEDIKGTVSAGVAGYVGPDWSHVNAQTSTVNLTGTTISTTQSVASVSGAVGSVSGAVGSVTGNVGGNVIGSTGSISGITFPTNFGALGIGSGGHVLVVDTLTTYTGNTPQTGDSFALIGAAGVGLTNLGDTRMAHLNADVSSRMATYTQPTGFLAATFPSGTIANTTNISAGTITTATNLTTNNDKTGYSLTQAFPTNFASLGISGIGHISNVDTLTTYTGNTPQTGDAYAIVNNGSFGNAQLLSAIQNVQNATFIASSIPPMLALPASSSTSVNIEFVFYDDTGAAKNLDSGNPAIILVNDAGADKSVRLGAWTNPATGKYVIPYTNTSSDALEGLHWDVTGTINGKLRRLPAFTQIVETISSTFTSSDRTILNALATGVTVTTNNDKTGYSLTQSFPANFSSLLIGGTGHISNVDTLTTYTGNTPQTGDSFGLIGTAGAGLTNLGDTRIAHLNVDVSSRMATYTQPNGFLAATFPSGTIASTTNISAGTITTATNLTNAPTNGDLTATMKASVSAAVPTAIQNRQELDTNSVRLVNLDTTVSSRLAASAYVSPPMASTIAAVTASALFVDGSANLLKVNSDHSVNSAVGNDGTIVVQNFVTIPPAVAAASQSANLITCLRGDTLRVELPPMGNLSTRTKLVFTAKACVDDSDDRAVFQVIEEIGLTRLHGRDAVNPATASLSVSNGTTGTATLSIDASITAMLSIEDLVWDAQASLATGIFSPISGIFSVVADVTQAVT